MIVTTSLLSYFIDISHCRIDDIYQTLNDIGIEVERLERIQVSKKVVVGKVISKNPHPNAQKLNVCQVDIGEQTLQIVCGAKNVQKDQIVALALEGAKLPAKDNPQGFIEIKKASLRGVESCGMICSSSELGFEKINDGIMVLDSSMGELILGKELSDYPLFNQYLLEVSLTPNRGDCLCVLGIARELGGAYNLPVIIPKEREYGVALGVGRALNLSVDVHMKSLLLYKAIEIQSLYTTIEQQLILAYNGLLEADVLTNYKHFITYMSGVLFNIYTIPKHTQLPITFKIKKDENGFEAVYNADGEKLSIIGVKNFYENNDKEFPTLAIIEANYIPPEDISMALFEKKIPQDKYITYRSTRGSNPELLSGMNLFCEVLYSFAQCSIYSGYQELEMVEDVNDKVITMTFDAISQTIGKKVQKEEIAQILKQLNFVINANGDGAFFRITPPAYRHDIHTNQDVVEEFLRIYRIKNIPSTPYVGIQKQGLNQTLLEYYNKRDLAKRALSQGFFETIHYVFYQRSKLEEWGYETIKNELDLTNPITNELDTLRTSLIPAMFDSVVRNQNMGYKSIKLFEIGSVYDANRVESKKMGFVVSGLQTRESYPYPKGIKWDFYTFAKTLSSIIGAFELVESTNPIVCAHPYQCADIIQDGKKIGTIAKLHPTFTKKYDIQDGYFAEIDSLPYIQATKAKPFSKLQPVQRDLTIIIDKHIPFIKIQEAIKTANIAHLVSFYPLDTYEDKNFALTIRMVFQPFEATLTEEEISMLVREILATLESSFDAKLKV